MPGGALPLGKPTAGFRGTTVEHRWNGWCFQQATAGLFHLVVPLASADARLGEIEDVPAVVPDRDSGRLDRVVVAQIGASATAAVLFEVSLVGLVDVVSNPPIWGDEVMRRVVGKVNEDPEVALVGELGAWRAKLGARLPGAGCACLAADVYGLAGRAARGAD